MTLRSARFAIVILFAQSAVAGAQASAPHSPLVTSGANAASPAIAGTSPDTVLIRNGSVTLTRGDYDLELMRLPPDARGGFGTDPTRVNALLNRMLIAKTMAAQARAAGIDKLPETQRRIAAETDRLLAALYVEHLDAETEKEFDARPGLEGAARERWLADPDKYKTPETASVTHILFDVSKHTKDEALQLAKDARASVVAGADMNALATAISEDPSAKRNGGRIEGFTGEQMDPAFARASFALKNPGDISEPMLSRFGYHVIRLDRKHPSTLRPFPEVKDAILAEMRNQYVATQREKRTAAIRTDPAIVVNEPAVEALVTRVRQEDFSRALEQAKAALPALKPSSSANPALK